MKIITRKKINQIREIYFANMLLFSYKKKVKYDLGKWQKYLLILRELHYILNPKLYLEIGTGPGNSATMADKETEVITIDPVSRLSKNLRDNCHIFLETSDDFFKNHNIINEFNKRIDLAFIDGMHLFEYYLRDFINIEKNSCKNSVIVIHDTTPIDEKSSNRERTQGFWTGDVFKIVLALKKYRPDLKIYNTNCTLTGVCCVTNLDPENDTLSKNYENILNEFMPIKFSELEKNESEILSINDDIEEFLKFIRSRGGE